MDQSMYIVYTYLLKEVRWISILSIIYIWHLILNILIIIKDTQEHLSRLNYQTSNTHLGIYLISLIYCLQEELVVC